MRLLTHNSLKSIAKDIQEGYPLKLIVTEQITRSSPLNEDFIRSIVPGLDWPALLIAAEAVGLQGMPLKFDPLLLDDNNFVQAIHTLLLDIHIEKGELICPDTGTMYPIVNGVPDMR